MNNSELQEIVREQLSIDYNCAPEDFLKDGVIITEAVKQKGRRALPFITPRCEMITMGNGIIVNASKDVLPFVKSRLAGKSKYDVLNSPFVYGQLYYYLPDVDNFKIISGVPGFEYIIVEREQIPDYYKYEGLHNALHYNDERNEALGVAVISENGFAGIACGIADSDKMCQIGVDILPEYRNKGLASSMVNKLTAELLNRGEIPYYFTDNSNLASQKTAIATGYKLAWIHSYKTRLRGKPFLWINYLRF